MYKIKDSLIEEKNKKERGDRSFYLFAAFILTLFTVIVALNTYVFAFVLVDGESMLPTLKDGDVLVINMLKDFERGDIVIVEGKKSTGDPLIKRVIAVGGDSLKIENGSVYLKKSGDSEYSPVNEPYLARQNITFYPTISNSADTAKYEFTIEEGQVFFLGDNRTNSSDSRNASVGTCKNSEISGVVEDWSLETRGILNCFYNFFRPLAQLFGKGS